ncbi:DUF2591 domain-containing protein [Leminorella grimontii]|uniref:DUF2591 domain-containing protein n=1 Tax=Leminorella grimontii TaxID=82981 RepID=UPI00207DFACE|nr:DUF2591 domain-containing protein [Leminorella grimontii]GKX60182.1 hypothetical protein SOASR031_24970 [Leminorella grimontii]
MDYEGLSDKEINVKVALALGAKEIVPDLFMSDDRRYDFDKPKNKAGNKFYFDPCNNPADAWPIIKDNCIDIIWDGDPNENVLRQAMIVFLMMKDNNP